MHQQADEWAYLSRSHAEAQQCGQYVQQLQIYEDRDDVHRTFLAFRFSARSILRLLAPAHLSAPSANYFSGRQPDIDLFHALFTFGKRGQTHLFVAGGLTAPSAVLSPRATVPRRQPI